MLNQIKSKPCVADAVIISSVLALFILSLLLSAGRSGGNTVTISTPESNTVYPLAQNRTIELSSEGYSLKIEIQDGSALISYSDCPDKICVHTGKINKNGESIVCLPAKVTVSISSEEESDEDWIIR